MGLTGSEDEYHDAYGLTKVLRLTEKHRNNREFYIIDFKMEDYEAMKDGTFSFFEIIKAKILSMQMATDYNQFLKKNSHEQESKIKAAVSKCKKTIRSILFQVI